MQKYLAFNFLRDYQTYLTLFASIIVTIVAITIFVQISHFSQHTFKVIILEYPLYGIFTPFIFVAIVYLVKFKCSLVGGSGIPQVLAALETHNKSIRHKLLSFRIAIGKILFIFVGMFFGAPIGIEGPSIHIGSSIFYSFLNSIQSSKEFLIHSFITIGGSIGLLIAFNAPLAAVIFAFEELGSSLKKQAIILIIIITGLTFLLLLFLRGNEPYLGNLNIHWSLAGLYGLILPILSISLICGFFGGLFSKLIITLINKITGSKTKVFTIIFILGSIIAVLNYLSDGSVAGSGLLETIQILNFNFTFGFEFVWMKFLATLVSVISVIPGGLFMPSISIGAGFGALWIDILGSGAQNYQLIIVLSMTAYLSAVIRAPITASLVILEVTNSLNLLPLAIIIAFISNFISSKIQERTLFTVLSEKFANEKS